LEETAGLEILRCNASVRYSGEQAYRLARLGGNSRHLYGVFAPSKDRVGGLEGFIGPS